MDVMMHGSNEQKRKGGRQRLEVIEVVITGERSREGGREDETWMEGAENGIFQLCKAYDSSHRRVGQKCGETS